MAVFLPIGKIPLDEAGVRSREALCNLSLRRLRRYAVMAISVEEKNAALWTLALITREVGSFIIEASRSFAAERKVVSSWFAF